MKPDLENSFIGQTEPYNTDWKVQSDPNYDILYVDINMSAAGFTKVPVIIPTLIGEVDNWVLFPTVALTTSSSFRIYLRCTDPTFTPSASDARTKGWNIIYYAMEPGGSNTLLDVTHHTLACDNA